ncbi:MAG TPA: ferritin-like domain-containing protein [Ktedonobacteraceae bacterium]|nr:ferritin-like domain-containing protein [Ktedonobacteraceae bacterium]
MDDNGVVGEELMEPVEEAQTGQVNGASAASVGAAEMQRFYTLAKRQAWKVEQLSWGRIPPVPEGKGSGENRARRQEIWRSVITQQLQADTLASLLSAQLLAAAPDDSGRLYYTTMVQDEGRHAEAWLRLTKEVGGVSEPDPYLDKLGELTLNADTIEEKVWLFQVVYEGLVIDRFRQIAEGTQGTILSELCTRLTIDDGIHHGAGVIYEQLLIARSSVHTKQAIRRLSQEMWPLFEEHLLWRPHARSWANTAMHPRDLQTIKNYIVQEQKLANKVGLAIDIPPGYEIN